MAAADVKLWLYCLNQMVLMCSRNEARDGSEPVAVLLLLLVSTELMVVPEDEPI